MAKKHQITPQERVADSQRAKKRSRNVSGQFMAGARAVGAASALSAGRSAKPPKENPMFGTSPSLKREMAQDEYARLKQEESTGGLSDNELRNLARHVTRSRIMGQEGPDVNPVDAPAMRARSTDVQGIVRMEREAGWQQQSGLYENPAVTSPKSGARRYTPPTTFINTELAPSHKRWLDQQLSNPNSEFSAGLNIKGTTHGGRLVPAQRNRVRIYTEALQQGKSHQEALQALRGERRGRPSAEGRPKRITGKEPQFNRYQGRRDKYQSLAPGQREFTFGVSAAGVDQAAVLRTKFPQASDKDIVRLQQYQRMNIANEMLKNQRWTHETRRANILGASGKESPDRVVFFTTSLGAPAVSVPSDSLIGQYIIGQRKKFLKAEGTYAAKDLKGKFPETVRDMHVVEAATGVALGAEGAWGAFQKSGWRIGKKKSSGYGKPIPVGSQILYDSQGRAVYDSNGNIRFTDGATRRFSVGTDRDLGLRIFVG